MSFISSFSINENKKPILEEFKKIAQREGRSKSDLAMELIEEYVKNHSNGNPAFTLEQFQDTDFKAMPAFATPMIEWKKFIMENTDKKELKEIDMKARSIVAVCRDKDKQDEISNSS